MKHIIHHSIVVPALLALCILHSSLCTAKAQGTAFTYQGQLNVNGSPANGLFDFQFALSTNATQFGTGGCVTNLGVGVTNGLFTTLIDFGPGSIASFIDPSNWMQISVAPHGDTNFTALTPPLQLTPTPSAIFATTASNVSGTVPASQLTGALPNTGLSGTYSSSVSFIDPSNTIVGIFTGNGAALSNLNASNLTSGILPLAQLPPAVVTNYASNAVLGSLTLDPSNTLPRLGALTLPFPAMIYSGSNTLLVEEGDLYLGLNAGQGAASGTSQVGFGDNVLASGSSGPWNTAIGEQALFANTVGGSNTASGFQALSWNTSGIGNTANEAGVN
jgi:hypothetical protein